MSRTLFVAFLLVVSIATHETIQARIWTDATGQYKVDADLIAFDDTTVVLQRNDHELGAVPIEKLSQADRDYLKSTEAKVQSGTVTDPLQLWTLRDGMKIRGRVVDYAQKGITLQRRRGRIYANDRVFENLPDVYQLMLPRIVAEFDVLNQPDKQGLEAWLVRQAGQPRTFTIEGVVMELENGDEYVIPFFFFAEDDLRILKYGWGDWLAAHQTQEYGEQQNQAFYLQSLAAARQYDRHVQRQIAMTRLNLEAIQAGVTDLWEVTLYPARGTAGPPLWVVMSSRDSRGATSQALAQYPGYVAGPVRKVSGF